MRSNTFRLLFISALIAAGCSHAPVEPVSTDDADAGAVAPVAATATSTTETPEPKRAEDQGAKLDTKDDSVSSAPPPKPLEPEKRVTDPSVRSAFSSAMQDALNGDSDAAIKELKDALTRDYKLQWAHYDLGVLYERRGNDDTALAEYKKALDIDAGFGPAALAEARLLNRQHRLGEAEGDLRARVNAKPDALGLRNALVFTLVQEKQYDQALVEAKKVLKADEKNADAMFQLGTVYYKQGKFELAQMVLGNAMAIKPDDPQIHNAMGFTHIALKEREKALEDFKAAAALSPDYAEAHNNLGELYNEAQDYPSAVRELELAVRDAPDFAKAHLNLGNAYRGNQQYDKALGEYQSVLRLRPRDANALFNLAVLYFDGDFAGMTVTDRLNKAGDYFDQYRASGGDDPKVDQYKKDLAKLLDKEKRRQEREEKDKLKKAQKAAQDAAKPKPAEAAPAPKAADSGSKLSDKPSTPAPAANGGKLGGGDDK